MRGRLRNNATDGEGDELPHYPENSTYFSIKVYHGGSLNENCTEYVGGMVSYFDMCNGKGLNMFEMEAMLSELGIAKGTYYLYLGVPGSTLPDGLVPLNLPSDIDIMTELVIYSRLQCIYCCPGGHGGDQDYTDFSFTQLLMDQKAIGKQPK
ncbi:hypothetical protein ACET3Z_028860 [Daucus carota]